jgi:hypothetical protein
MFRIMIASEALQQRLFVVYFDELKETAVFLSPILFLPL